MKKTLFKGSVISCALALLTSYSAHAITLKVADNHLAIDSTVLALKSMNDELKKTTNGEVKLRIFANGALGDETQVLQDVQKGTVDMARVSVSNLQSFNDKFSILSMPYLFPSNEAYLKFSLSPLADTFYAYPESSGIKGLTFYTSSFRSFYTRDKGIEKPADLKGVKIRVMADPTVLNMMKRLGATATPLPYSEVFGAMQQGVVDGAENAVSTLTDARHGEMMKAYSFDEHTLVPDIVVISSKTWAKLTPDQQVKLKQAALNSAVMQTEEQAKVQAKAKKDAEAMGVKFYYPEKKAFQDLVEPMYSELPADKMQQVTEIRNSMQ
ncbi:TRAP transporter substrate-binding protein [Buttiauxella sp. A2-C2_NF]|uniref:TRAP transporter substrate-binding protein n=1 Tax=Buttiauxella TaxID=82976 RepID=UPI00105CC911|nr:MULTISPECIES: TRAP transporter substrate-binding protein [Buttiauxella]MCE0828302.1 TRAP transporter substrate-binding protein [Buttiauxella ferragutiae]TDN49449.1 tripartite ATP-independent transporter DctP family solute receptor [Buttiauxella sp. JUb87]